MNAQPVAEPHYPRLESVLDALAHWITKYRQRAAAREEIARCDPDEVARIAHDLGISPAQLRELSSKSADSSMLLGKMLVSLGVDGRRVASEDSAVMRDLQRLCVTCGSRERCIHELAAGTAGAHYHEFCPNAYTLDALLEQQQQEKKSAH